MLECRCLPDTRPALLQFIANMSEELFRDMLAENQMATDKLEEGVAKFAADQEKCEKRIAERAAMWGMSLI